MRRAACLTLCGAVILLVTYQASADPGPSPFSASSATMQSARDSGQLIVPSARGLPETPVSSSDTGVHLAIYLCLLVVLLGGGSYLLKNGFTFLQPKAKGAKKLSVAETRMLGNRQFLVVAEYEGRKMLLGVCPGRIDLLSELGGKADEPFANHLSEAP